MAHDTCAACATPLTPTDKFCGKCGSPVVNLPADQPGEDRPREDVATKSSIPLRLGQIDRRLLATGAGILALFLLIAAGVAIGTAFRAPEGQARGAVSVDDDEGSGPAPTANGSPGSTVTPSPAPSSESRSGLSFEGVWVGDILGDSRPYSINATVSDRDGRISAVANYPEIPCKGTWVQASRDGTTAVVVETMPTTNVCYDQVAITLTLNGDGTMSYSAQSGAYFISSRLRRVGG